MKETNIKVGTRGSKLALKQCDLFKDFINENLSEPPELEIEVIQTKGCKRQGTKKANISDKNKWVEEIRKELISGKVDIAIHSGKDIPSDFCLKDSKKTNIYPICQSYNNDVLITRNDLEPGKLKVIGTSSLRREALAQITILGCEVKECRGNIDTRLEKLISGEYDGIILALAGVERLFDVKVSNHDTGTLTYQDHKLALKILDENIFVPAALQGVVACEVKKGTKLDKTLSELIPQDLHARWQAERAVINTLEGDCESRIGVNSKVEGDMIEVNAIVISQDGLNRLQDYDSGEINNAQKIGKSLAKSLLKSGADQYI